MVPAALIDFSVFCRFEQVFVAVLKVIGDTICISEKLQKQNKLLAVSSKLTLCYIGMKLKLHSTYLTLEK